MTILRQSRKAAPELQAILTKAGGTNLYGEPRFRIVWAAGRLTWIGGEWLDYDENGVYLRTVAELRESPKYFHLPPDIWIIEKYCPPEMYGSRARWEATTYETIDGRRLPALGPYPERGDYECSWPVAVTRCKKHKHLEDCLPVCANHQYLDPIDPTITVLEMYVQMVLKSEQASDYERTKAIERELAREEQNKKRIQGDILGDQNQLYTGSYVDVPRWIDHNNGTVSVSKPAHYQRALQVWKETTKGKVN